MLVPPFPPAAAALDEEAEAEAEALTGALDAVSTFKTSSTFSYGEI